MLKPRPHTSSPAFYPSIPHLPRKPHTPLSPFPTQIGCMLGFPQTTRAFHRHKSRDEFHLLRRDKFFFADCIADVEIPGSQRLLDIAEDEDAEEQ